MIDSLIAAGLKLLRSRYADGACDSAALSEFEAALNQTIDSAGSCRHARLIEHAGDETFEPRLGCLDCNVWLDPVRFRAVRLRASQ